MEDLKTCSKCREAKPRTAFCNDRSRRDGLRHFCRPCGRERTAEWRRKNPERNREIARRWQEANPEKVRAKEARRSARRIVRAKRYLRAFRYFEGRPGWLEAVARACMADRNFTSMCFLRPDLEAYVAEKV